MLVLDLAGVGDRQEFMDRVSADLRLPDWFGRNWDALADCLTDLSWWPVEPGGRRLHVRNWHDFADRLPRDWRIVKDILHDAELFWRHTDTELTITLD
ncbi:MULTISPECIES: barstar family protein [Streptomycetaceae]|uniref:barstar family protein n=1 Tax=Streptomycetaceae TaxID=2062 RepID=UPI0030091D55